MTDESAVAFFTKRSELWPHSNGNMIMAIHSLVIYTSSKNLET